MLWNEIIRFFPNLIYQNSQISNFICLMHDFTIDEKVLMMWRNHTEGVLGMLIYRARIRLEEAYDATLERPNA